MKEEYMKMRLMVCLAYHKNQAVKIIFLKISLRKMKKISLNQNKLKVKQAEDSIVQDLLMEF